MLDTMELHCPTAAPSLRAWLNQRIPAPVSGHAAHPLRLLLADDCIANQAYVEAVLGHWGIEPTIASDGEEAVQLAHLMVFDVVLMDIVMPVLHGVAATQRIRSFGHDSMTCPTVPIIAYSSLNLVRDRALLERVGLSDVLARPCTPTSLRACLEQWCPDRFRQY
jgi:CheY-like chemotaxis protein